MSYKVVLIGEGRVGKSSIGNKWSYGKFDSQQRSTIAVGCFQKTVNTSDGKAIDIRLWDTAGQEEYHSLTPIYYKDAHLALIVYSVTDTTSFERMVQWKKELDQSRGTDIKIVIAANKIDLVQHRVVTQKQGLDFATSINVPIFEVSAKTGESIDLMFQNIAKILSEIPQQGVKHQRTGKMGLMVVGNDSQEAVEKKNGGCC